MDANICCATNLILLRNGDLLLRNKLSDVAQGKLMDGNKPRIVVENRLNYGQRLFCLSGLGRLWQFKVG